jgi:hypothetical protein
MANWYSAQKCEGACSGSLFTVSVSARFFSQMPVIEIVARLESEMKFTKRLLIIAALPLFLSGCGGAVKGLQAGVAKLGEGIRIAGAAPYNKVGSQWRGKPITQFQDKFGAPTNRSNSGEATVLTWQRSRMVRIPARTYEDESIVGNVIITKRRYVPEHDSEIPCTVALTVKGGVIAQVKTLDDGTVPVGEDGLFSANTSACQIVFGQ